MQPGLQDRVYWTVRSISRGRPGLKTDRTKESGSGFAGKVVPFSSEEVDLSVATRRPENRHRSGGSLEDASMEQPSIRASARMLSPSRAILYGWLVVGTLDGLDAAIVSTLRGSNPVRVFQYVASGLLGPS